MVSAWHVYIVHLDMMQLAVEMTERGPGRLSMVHARSWTRLELRCLERKTLY